MHLLSLDGMRASSNPITCGPGYGWLSEGWLPVAKNTRSAVAALLLLLVIAQGSGRQAGCTFELGGDLGVVQADHLWPRVQLAV